MNPDLLNELIGKQVEVRSQAGNTDYRDDGILEAYSAQWIKLRKDGGLIYFPIANVRLLKPL